MDKEGNGDSVGQTSSLQSPESHGVSSLGAHFWTHKGKHDDWEQHGLTNMIVSRSEMPTLVNAGRATDVPLS